MTHDGDSPYGEIRSTCPHQLWRIQAVTKCTTVSVPTLYRLMVAGIFPPGMLNGGCRLWHGRSINSWLWSRAEASWIRQRLAEPVPLVPWSPEMEMEDAPDIQLVRRCDALDVVGLAKTAFYNRNLGPGRWTVEAALLKMERKGLNYVPTPAPVQLTQVRAAWIADELRQYVELCADVLGPDGPELTSLAA